MLSCYSSPVYLLPVLSLVRAITRALGTLKVNRNLADRLLASSKEGPGAASLLRTVGGDDALHG